MSELHEPHVHSDAQSESRSPPILVFTRDRSVTPWYYWDRSQKHTLVSVARNFNRSKVILSIDRW